MKRFRSDQADVVDTGGAHDGDGAGNLFEGEVVGTSYERHFFSALLENFG